MKVRRLHRLACSQPSIPQGLLKKEKFIQKEISMTNQFELRPEYIKKLDFGKPRDFWTLHLEQVKGIIKEYDLIAAESVDLPHRQEFEAMEMPEAAGNRERTIKPRPFPGGMLIPHFHYKGEVYLVPEKKWQAISMKIKDTLVEKLANANRLSFDQVMTLSETIDSI